MYTLSPDYRSSAAGSQRQRLHCGMRLKGTYQHSMQTQVLRHSPGVQSGVLILAGAWAPLSSSCMADSKA